MDGVKFDEDKSISAPIDLEEKFPGKGFEGWFYKMFPGTFKSKRIILISIILIIFVVSFVFFVMTRYNSGTKDRSENFSKLILQTKIK